nr:ribonuclease H-like domain, reverse transcriptase, RNA-dependent DNA polymerase [Tanacetum cinerariifolium]
VELNEAYVVSLFIGGLKKEVSMPIRMFKITNLIDVYAMAKMQEATNAVLKPRYNSSLLPTPKFVSNSVNKHVIAPFKSINVNGVNQNVSKIGGNRPYRLTRKQLYSLEVVGENNNELVAEAEGEIFEDYVDEVLTIDSTPQISLNALCGLNSFQTMRVKGMFRKHTLHILWSLQKETFTSDVMFLPLEGCEMVLGIQCKNKEKHPACQALWLKRVLSELTRCEEKRITLKVDNVSAIALVKNPVFHGRSKHIDIRYYFIRECVENGHINVEHVSGELQRADILTKALPRLKFVTMRQMLRVQDLGRSNDQD